MKKSIFVALMIGVLAITACSKNDDDKKDCQTCNLDADGESISFEICDNGDGTITITSGGQSETEDLEGATFEDAIAIYEVFLGATCN
jgi:uncharacterized lipoprotein YehR (DUF1307 family)